MSNGYADMKNDDGNVYLHERMITIYCYWDRTGFKTACMLCGLWFHWLNMAYALMCSIYIYIEKDTEEYK